MSERVMKRAGPPGGGYLQGVQAYTPSREDPMTPLRRKMLADLKVRNYADRTQRMYIARVA